MRRRTALAALALACMPAIAAAQPVTGPSGWSWSDPRPQGEFLDDVRFEGATGHAVGGFGTVLRSEDGGATWRGIRSGTTTDLTRLGDPAPGLVLASGGCTLRVSRDGGVSMTGVALAGSDAACATSVVATSFADGSVGFIVLSDGSVLVTRDGGRSLSRATALPGTAAAGGLGTPTDFLALSATRAVALVGADVYRTTDGGSSWTLAARTGGTLRDLTVSSATVLYVVGDNGVMQRSTDAGDTWNPVAGTPPRRSLVRVACASDDLCLVATGSTEVLRTPDRGATFTTVTPSDRVVTALSFAAPARAVAVGQFGLIAVSDDAGVTWRTLRTRALPDVTRLVPQVSGDVVALGRGAVAGRSADGGQTWTTVAVPTASPVSSVSFAGGTDGYALDASRTLFRTGNRGASWEILDTGTGRPPHTVVALAPRTVALVADRQVRRSLDGGVSFQTRAIPLPRGARVDAAGLAGARLLAWGRAVLMVSADAGATWQRLRLPVVARRAVRLRQAACAGPRTCWIVTTGGRVLLTSTAGRRWTDVTAATGRARIAGLAAASARRAYLTLAPPGFDAAPGGWVLATTDGGATWDPQRVDRFGVDSLVTTPRGDVALTNAAGPVRVFSTTTAGRTETRTTLTLRAVPAAVRRPATVTLRGRLQGARGGETVVVTAGDGSVRRARVASNGSFTLSARVRATTTFVAQWGGEGARAGDGSPVVTVRRR